MGNALVSVIVPVYKVEKYLAACVESVLSQTYKNLELILVDDGSPDRCGEICDRYACADARVRVIHQENGGLSAARNAGIDIAAGAYIAFLDSDDMLHPQFLQLCVDALEKNGADMAAYRFQEICEEDKNYKKGELQHVDFETVSIEQVKKDFYKLFPDVLTIAAWSRVYDRKLFENARFKERIIYEDLQILPQLLEACEKISYTDTALYYYRQTPNSIVRSDFSIKRFDMLLIEKDSLIPFLEKNATRENINKAYDSYIDNYVYLHFMKYRYDIKGNVLDISYALLYKKLLLVRWKKYMRSGGKMAILLLLSLVSIKLAYCFAKKCCATMFPYLR